MKVNLKKLKKLLSSSGVLVLSTASIINWIQLLTIIFGDFPDREMQKKQILHVGVNQTQLDKV